MRLPQNILLHKLTQTRSSKMWDMESGEFLPVLTQPTAIEMEAARHIIHLTTVLNRTTKLALKLQSENDKLLFEQINKDKT